MSNERFYSKRGAKTNSEYHCLDFNEYQGEIAASTAKVLANKELLRHYPQTTDRTLESQLAQWVSCPEESLYLVNGADDGILHILLYAKIYLNQHSFQPFFSATYDHAKGFSQILCMTKDDEARKYVRYICLPNNPTGEEMSLEDLDKFLESSSKNDLLIFDLTYAAYSNRPFSKYVNKIIQHKNAVCVFSLNKFFPLAGVRMGCVISSCPDLTHYFKNSYNRKTVNTVARAVTADCIENNDFYQDQRDEIFSNREVVGKCFEAVAQSQGLDLKLKGGLPHQGGNFTSLSGPEEDVQAFVKLLYSVGILVRTKPHWGGLVRITSVNDKELKKLRKKLLKLSPVIASTFIRKVKKRSWKPELLSVRSRF